MTLGVTLLSGYSLDLYSALPRLSLYLHRPMTYV